MNTAIHSHHTGSHHWLALAVAGAAALAIGAGSYAVIRASDANDPVQKSPAVVLDTPVSAPAAPTAVVPDANVSSPVEAPAVVPVEEPAVVVATPHATPGGTENGGPLGGPEGTGLVPRTEITKPRSGIRDMTDAAKGCSTKLWT